MHTVKSSKAELMWSLHTFWFFTCSLFSIFRLKNPKTGPKKGNSNCCSLFFSKGLVSLRAHSSNSVFKKIKSNQGTQMFTTTIFRGDLPTPKQPLWCHAQPWLHRGTPSWYRAAKNPQCQKAEIKFSVLCGNPAGFHDTGSLQLYLWMKPFSGTGASACSRKGHGSVLHSRMTPSPVSSSQMHLVKQILPSKMETWTGSLASFLNRFLSLPSCSLS